MRKIKDYIFFMLLAGISIYGQNKRVGINTADPKQTLDVEGTVAIDDLPFKNHEVIPLALAKDGQVIASADDDNDTAKPFKIVNFKLKLSTESEDWIDAIDLKIPTDKYTLFLMSANLVDDTDTDSFGQPSSVFLNLLALDELRSGGHQPELFMGEYVQRGRVQVTTGNNNYHADYLTSKVGIGARQVYLYPYSRTGTWKLYADYPASRGINFNFEANSNREKVVHPRSGAVKHNATALKFGQTYTWNVSVLIVKNDWIESKDVSLDLKPNSDYQPKVNRSVLP